MKKIPKAFAYLAYNGYRQKIPNRKRKYNFDPSILSVLKSVVQAIFTMNGKEAALLYSAATKYGNY